MAFTAADVLENAREILPEGTEDKHPPWTLLRALSRIVRRLTNKIVQRDRYFISGEISISLPLADFAAGADLSADKYIRLNGGIATLPNGNTETFHVVSPPSRYDNSGWPGGWIMAETLHLLGRATDWTPYTSITLYSVPVPADITTEATTVPLPDSALEPCAYGIAVFMGRRIPLDRLQLQNLSADLATFEASFLDEIQERHHVTKTTIRDVT